MNPATELEAVNAMLSAVGQAPVSSLAGTLPTDVAMARDFLTRSLRETLAIGWRFNTEFGYELAPFATLDWTDTTDQTVTLNIFKPPVGLSSFTLTPHPWQQGFNYVDTEIRPSRLYQESGQSVLVFYDRAGNRDGFYGRPYLYINPVWLFGYEEIPSVARDYIYIKASRRFQQQVAGSPDLAGLTLFDETTAQTELRKKQGLKDDYNIFKNPSVNRVFGRRPFGSVGVGDYRINPNKA